eukprot:TRINITY_DN12844_c0_g1_i2.p1 TRINITY_DN12844_c0_g1~~TRINITY_DN12844_c0_g1_i2.p1  ORF type:complete len:179 (-),score=15.64 TRINITY_DN12844_c0_g1_i2:136-672(-)
MNGHQGDEIFRPLSSSMSSMIFKVVCGVTVVVLGGTIIYYLSRATDDVDASRFQFKPTTVPPPPDPLRCSQCLKSFGSLGSLQKHLSSVSHWTLEHVPPSPVSSIGGGWIPAIQWEGSRKTYGAYECRECNHKWLFADSHPRSKVSCEVCNTHTFVKFLWLSSGLQEEGSLLEETVNS